MNVREFNARILSPGSQFLMIFGIIALCQPWVEFLHQWSVLMMLIGLIGFNFSVHIAPPDPVKVDEDDTGPVSVTEVVGRQTHG